MNPMMSAGPDATGAGLIRIDGSQGEGGGQILRTSLSLSVLTGRPLEIDRIRAGRERPGLQRQHLACVEAAARVSGAVVEGGVMGSTRLLFRPGRVSALRAEFRVDGAGSALLVLQTVLPALLRAEGVSEVVVEGGTHNPLAPPFPFVARSFVPLLRRMGFDLDVELERAGFAPRGGGRCRLRVRPGGAVRSLVLDPVAPAGPVRAEVQSAGLPASELEPVLERLARRWGLGRAAVDWRELPGGGGAGWTAHLMVPGDGYENVFTGFGASRVRPDVSARAVSGELESFRGLGVPVDEHLADQLLLPMVLAGGGRFRAGVGASLHLGTNATVINQFLGPVVRLEPVSAGVVEVVVEG